MIKHPGPSVGYRLEQAGGSLAYLSDHEPALGADLGTIEAEWISGLGLARNADVLFHDGQYTRDEYEARVGWGHSTPEHAVTFATRAGVHRLVLFHHDPTHTDEQLDGMLAAVEPRAADASLTVELGREGAAYGTR
jgi:ribonuclease BN (tRNA processing enzyme)